MGTILVSSVMRRPATVFEGLCYPSKFRKPSADLLGCVFPVNHFSLVPFLIPLILSESVAITVIT